MANEPVFTLVSLYSLAGVAGILAAAFASQARFLAPNARGWDRFAFTWLVFDGLTHFSYEGSFLWLSTLSKAGTVNGSRGIFADIWKEYAKADSRWGTSDPTVVSLEILTVLGAGPLCLYIASQIVRDEASRHYWIVVLCTAELYGGWMTFCPEWLTGSQALATDNWLHLWVYLVFMNLLWVFIPLALMYDSYRCLFPSSASTSAPIATRTRSKLPKVE